METKVKYITTKAQCAKQISDNVCDGCGRQVVPIKTVDNSGAPTYWAGCFHGGQDGNFTWGCKKDVYEYARKMVLDGMYSLDRKNYYDFDSWLRAQTVQACRMIDRFNAVKNGKTPYMTLEQLKKNMNGFFNQP